MNVAKHSVVPRPFLNANILVDRIELDSSHQSSLDLSICSNILHREEEIAIGIRVLFTNRYDFIGVPRRGDLLIIKYVVHYREERI